MIVAVRLPFLRKIIRGYRNLTVLISRAYQEGQILGRPLLRRDWIESHSEGLLVLSGGRNGDVGSTYWREGRVTRSRRSRGG